MALRLSLYSSQYTWWLRPFQNSSQSPWWYSDYPYTHHRLPGGTQTIPLLIIVSLVALRLFLYSSQSTLCLRQSLYTSQSPWWYSDYSFTHHSLHCGTQTIPIIITVSLMVLRLSLYSPHHILFSGTQTNPLRIIVSLVVLRKFPYSPQSTWWLRQFLYPSQSPSWYQNYPFTHHSPHGGT